MAITITINGSVTLDESDGLQSGVAAAPPEDNNDSDVSLATLQADAGALVFYNRLFTAGGLNLSSAFATANGVARSASNYIALSGTGSIVSLGFTTGSGAALPVYGVDLVGAACNLVALDGGAITLFSDSVLGSRVAYGVDSDGDIVFAMFMDPAAGLATAEVWMVQFEAFDNPDATNHDDPLTLTGLGVGAGVSTEFSFAGLPSGQNLFGMVGSTTSALIVIGKNPVLNPDGTFTNASNTINTSQGGGNTTIGVNNQMFDPGEGAYFTFVRSANSNFLGTNLDANEADDADNMQYTDGNGATNDTIESNGAFLKIAQIQGNSLATLSLAAFNIAGSPQGTALIAASGQNAVAITQVKVYNAAGALIEDSGLGGGQNAAVVISFSGGVATVSGLDAGYKVEWFTANSSIKFDQVLVTGIAGKFDIGGFGLNEASSVSTPLTGVRFEDDGPVVDLELAGDAELLVDESGLDPDLAPPGVSDSILAADLFSINSEDFGTDGAGTADSVYELLMGDPNSGLIDTATLDEVILEVNGAGTLITGSVNAGADVVFTIALDADTGEVTLTQYRAMVHGDNADPDEADTPLTLAADTVRIQRTITDGDDDSDSDDVDISAIFKFRDDGPVLQGATQDVIELRTDDTDIDDTATLSTDTIFPNPPDFGSDGPNAIDPVLYELRIDSGVPGSDPNDSGLIDTETGDKVLVVKVGDDIVGYVDEDGSGAIEAGETLEAIRFSLTEVDLDSETVTFTQSRSVVHDDVNDPVEAGGSAATIAPNLIELDQIAVDGDDDVSDVETFDLGAITFIEDDGPDIGPIANGLVDFELNSSVNNSLEGVVGNDPNASPYILTAYTTNLTVNGVALEGVLQNSATQVTYYADSDGDLDFGSAGDIAYYRLALTQAGEGDYTFTVLIDPPPAFTEFRFDDLPSGSNLFGIVGDAGAGLVIFGKNIGLKADNTYIANLTQEVKTSQAGLHDTIGIESQMFDPGDAAYFTFVNTPDPNYTGTALGSTEADDADNILYGSTLENDSAFIRIAQLQGNTDPSMSIQLFNIAGSPQGVAMLAARGTNAAGKDPDVTAVRVYDALGNLLEDTDDLVNFDDPDIAVSFLNGVATVTGFGTDFKVEWDADEDFDQTLITGVAGKFDIGGFGFLQGNDTPDQLLEFTAQVTDGDGDTDTASWKVGIDGTGVFDDNLVSGVII